MEPILTFVDEPVYMRDITESLQDCHVEDEYTYCVMSIDIGILHLGISVATLDEEYNMIEIIWIDLIDITEFIHKWGVSPKECLLYHTKTLCDWLNHTYQENIDFFEKADYILIERQPIPEGFTAVEQLIFSRWRDKAFLVHPRSVHKYFNMGYYEYDQRKVISEKIARAEITNPDLQKQLGYYNRAHDITDSILIILYWINIKQQEYQGEKRRKEIMNRRVYFDTKIKNGDITTEEMFESWRHINLQIE
jgi:hypothetical protein